MTTKNNRAPFQYYVKLCASFQSHQWRQTGLHSANAQFMSKLVICSPMWPWNWWMTLKTTDLLFYTISSFVHHFKAISLTNLSYSLEMINSCQNWWFFIPCDLKIWWMTLKNHRVPLPYHVKLCASFQSHQRIQSGVTVRKLSIRTKISNFLSRVTLNLIVGLERKKGTSSML